MHHSVQPIEPLPIHPTYGVEYTKTESVSRAYIPVPHRLMREMFAVMDPMKYYKKMDQALPPRIKQYRRYKMHSHPDYVVRHFRPMIQSVKVLLFRAPRSNTRHDYTNLKYPTTFHLLLLPIIFCWQDQRY